MPSSYFTELLFAQSYLTQTLLCVSKIHNSVTEYNNGNNRITTTVSRNLWLAEMRYNDNSYNHFRP
jgi:hypothetical protein